MIEPNSANNRPHSFINRFPALKSRNYRLLWLGQGVSAIGSFMQVWAINWQLYAMTHKAIALGMIGLFRVVPIILLSLVGGTVADAWDRRKVMLVTQSSLTAVAGLMWLLTITHHITPVWIYLLTMAGASAMAFDNPSRQSLIPRLVPREHLTSAISMNSVVFRTATIVGPVLAGLLIARSSLAATYLINAASFLAVIGALLAMRESEMQPVPPVPAGETRTPVGVNVRSMREGLDFVRKTPLLMWTIWLDFFATFFSSANALMPIFARDILHSGATGYGVLAAAEAVGALVAGVLLSFLPTITRQGPTVLWAVVIYGAATVVFGASHLFVLSWLALAVVGASDSVSTILRQTIRQLMTPDHLRGRMTSVNMIFFMGGPQLGEFEAGLAANWLGAARSVILGGIGCLLTVAWVASRAPVLRRYTSHKEQTA